MAQNNSKSAYFIFSIIIVTRPSMHPITTYGPMGLEPWTIILLINCYTDAFFPCTQIKLNSNIGLI